MLAWKRGIAILTASQVKVTPDPRVRLVNGYTLQIRDALPTDAGDYICQIATYEPKEIIHHVEILSKIAFPLFIVHFTLRGFLYLSNLFSFNKSFNTQFYTLPRKRCSHTLQINKTF